MEFIIQKLILLMDSIISLKNMNIKYIKEPIVNVLIFKDQLDWVWIDTITQLPVNKSNHNILKKI